MYIWLYVLCAGKFFTLSIPTVMCMYSYFYICSVLGIVFRCVVLCIVDV